MLSNTTHRNINLGLGGGYDYEFLLGAEIALVSLLPEFKADWSCDEEEIPIFSHIRKWAGQIAELTSEQPVGKGQSPVGEDLNLLGDDGSRLHIQIKSGTVSMEELKKVVRRLVQVYELHNRKSQFLLVTGSLPKAISGCQTLADLPEDSPTAKILSKIAEARLKDIVSVRSFLGNVHLTRAPLYERVSASLHGLVARFSRLNRSKPAERKQIGLLVDAYRTRFARWAMRRDQPLAAKDLQNFLLAPPTFRELAEKYALEITFKETPLLRKLQELLGWSLHHLGSENVFLILSATSEDPTPQLSGLQSLKVKQVRATSSAKDWDERDTERFNFEPNFIFILRLVRLASVLSGSLVTPQIEKLASEGQEVPRLLCLLARGNELAIVDSYLTIEISDLGKINRLYKEPCESFLETLCVGIPWIDSVVVKHTLLLSDSVPYWMNQEPTQLIDYSESDGNIQTADKQQGLERRIAERLSNMRSLAEVEGTQPKEMALLDLELLAKECRTDGLELLLGSINETRVSILKKLNRQDEIAAVLLDSIEVFLAVWSSLSTTQWLLRSVSRLTKLSAEDQLRYQVLLAQDSSVRSDFRALQSVCKKIDPSPLRPLDFPNDESVFSVRLSEIRATLMHGSVGEAIEAADRLLGRMSDAPADKVIEAHLIALKIARAAELAPVARKFQASFRRVSAAIEPAKLESKCLDSLVYAQALDAHLDFFFSKEGDEMNRAYQEWLHLNQTIADDQVWAIYFLDRLQIGTQRGLVEWNEDDRRVAAAAIRRKKRSVGQNRLRSAGAYLAAGNHQSALESVYQAMDASLEENTWATWTEAKSLLAVLWLADNRNVRAADAYICDGAFSSEKTFLRDLEERLTEAEVAEVVDLVIVPTLSDARRGRGWSMLDSVVDKIDVRSRLKILDFAERAVLEPAETKAQRLATAELAKLIGGFFKCPTDEEAPRELKLLLELLKSGALETRREVLQMMRTAFCSATGPTLANDELETLLQVLDSLFSDDERFDDEKQCGIDIATAFIRNNPKARRLSGLAFEFVKKHGAEADTEGALALSSLPVSSTAVSRALDAALRILGRRVERLPDGSVRTSLYGDNVNEIIPFLPHLSSEEIANLYDAMLTTGFDSEADAHLRGQVFEFIKNPIFQSLPITQLSRGIELFYQRLEGRHSENIFDRSHRETNNSIYSGLRVSADLPLRIQRDALIALAAFQRNPLLRDIERYADLLGRLAFSENMFTRVSVGKSIKVYFECCDLSDPLISPILVRLISDSDDEVASSGIIAAAEELEATGNLDFLTFRLLDSVYRSNPSLQRRKALAVFCRLAVTSGYRGPHRTEVIRWHCALLGDRNSIVRKHADTNFWKVRRTRGS